MLTVVMSAQEQLFLELVNRARADPEAEVLRTPGVTELNQEVADDRLISSDPKQPLAPHQSLVDAMIGHAEDMLARNFFAHENPDGESPSDRALAAGYPVGAGENIAWSGNTGQINENEEVYLRHIGLVESVGHRINMMREIWKEIGPGIRYGVFTQDGENFRSIMAGTLFGNRNGESFITGVAINDRIAVNNFYEIGEGLGDVLITAINTDTEERYSVRTGPSGGYGLQVPDGIYNLTATGSLISRPLRVNGVNVSGENIKVDFNSRLMDTRYIEGHFFKDDNANGVRDSNEVALAGHTAYIDFNNNGQLDAGEPNETTDATGLYRIDSLLPAEFIVRQADSEGWEASVEGAYVIDASDLNIVDIDFGLTAINIPPVAHSDSASGAATEEITINVLQNDSDPDGSIDVNSIRITSSPQHGHASIQGPNVLYTADADFSGRDEFTYTVDDMNGKRSNVATISVQIHDGKAWQNPINSRDVDGDGFVIPRDVLTLISEINSVGSHALQDRIRQSNSPYFDVSGDGWLSPVDVLSVVLYLNGLNSSGEPPHDERPESVAIDQVFAALAVQDDEDETVVAEPLAN